jgi:sRNA-binding carbon storage regulator CsrA
MEATKERTRLILTRRTGQVLWVGDTRIRFDARGRLVIEADKETRIVRDEIRTRAA